MTTTPGPRTEAGKRLLANCEMYDICRELILAIEAEAASLDRDELRKAVEALDAPFRWLQENYPKAFVEMPTPYFRAFDKVRAGNKAEAPE